jgi:hypothetical protein
MSVDASNCTFVLQNVALPMFMSVAGLRCVAEEWRFGKGLEGRNFGLIEVPSPYVLGETEEIHENISQDTLVSRPRSETSTPLDR